SCLVPGTENTASTALVWRHLTSGSDGSPTVRIRIPSPAACWKRVHARSRHRLPKSCAWLINAGTKPSSCLSSYAAGALVYVAGALRDEENFCHAWGISDESRGDRVRQATPLDSSAAWSPGAKLHPNVIGQ